MSKKIFSIIGIIIAVLAVLTACVKVSNSRKIGKPSEEVSQAQQKQENSSEPQKIDKNASPTTGDSQAYKPKKSVANKQGLTPQEEKIRATIEKILSSEPPAGYEPIPQGVRVLDVEIDGNKVTINLSKELLSKGTGAAMEDAIHQITSPLSDVVPEIKDGEYDILVEGIPLQKYLK